MRDHGPSCCTLEQLDRYISGELQGDEAAALGDRIGACATCQSMAEELRSHVAIVEDARRARNQRAVGGGSRAKGDWAPNGYEILRTVHRGGQAVVFEALHTQTGRKVALKVLRDDREVSPAARLRFQREFELVRLLDHPGIVPVYEAGLQDGRRFLVLRLIAGEAIDAWIARGRPPLADRLGLFAAVCAAVHHAHLRGVIHRDIKPANVLVDGDGHPHVLDFGVARRIDIDPRDGSAGLTLTGEFTGTLPYASPEQLRGESAPDIRTDVYSLGVLLYHMVTGNHPFAARSSVADLVHAIEHEDPCPPSFGAPEAGHELDAIVSMAMAKDKERRYQSAGALMEDVHRHLRHDPVMARGDGLRYLVMKTVRRHRLAASLVALLVVTLATSAMIAIQLARTAADGRTRARAAEMRALRERDELDRALAAWRQLSDSTTARNLLGRVDGLFPVTESLVPQCDEWLAAARKLSAAKDGHAAALAQLRTSARPATLSERRVALPALARELDEHRSEAADLEARVRKGTTTKGRLDECLARVADVSARMDGHALWVHESHEDQWRDDVLSQLVGDITTLETRTDEIVRRRDLAARLRRVSLEEAEDAWRACIESLAGSDHGRHIRLEPRCGLVPLRHDPATLLWEFWHVASGDRPEWDEELETWFVGRDTGLVLVLLPGGAFPMGARRPGPDEPEDTPNVDPLATALSTPVHEVVLAPFFISKYEITEGQWLHVFSELPGASIGTPKRVYMQPDRAYPLTGVTWDAAVEGSARLGMTLPTESQWEYACRGGTTTVWFTGNDPESLDGHANIFDQGSFPRGIPHMGTPTPGISDGHTAQAPVGLFKPNPFGLHDMTGNLSEWCLDRMHPTYDIPWRPGDGLRRGTHEPEFRAKRGASYALTAHRGASGTRGSDTRETTDRFSGFRPVLPLE
jgi:formylglycine-generating enzyme required for sulfatase activity/tRNA A-37 threonylcarbamoyl transferase component Bud32